MKQYNKIFTLAAAAATALAFAACDNIHDDQRFIEVPKIESARVVLLEDYTGQKCINCPNGHEVVEALSHQYPDNFIAVAIHGDGKDPDNSWSLAEPRGLRNDEGQAYSRAYGIANFPTAIINHQPTHITTPDTWAAEVLKAMKEPAYLDMAVDAIYDPEAKQLDVTVDCKAHDTVSGTLQIWVVEDEITSQQLMPDGSTNRNYVHNHVLRGTVNGLNGEPFAVRSGEEATATSSCPVKDRWNVTKLSVVAFVYNNSGVQQAAKCKVTVPE